MERDLPFTIYYLLLTICTVEQATDVIYISTALRKHKTVISDNNVNYLQHVEES